ncbi:Mur ligase family protein [Puniceicoccaceae bacterium K14]|nr:Mur ligase family protein [Puniceicoccaceae bacterium K14]
MAFSGKDLKLWSRGLWNSEPAAALEGFTNDTRQLNKGDVFVALKTNRRDGHDFLDAAQEAGASAALVSEFRQGVDLPQLKVENALLGLQRIAASYRAKFSGPVVGVTGSCGKTTCKDLIATLLGGDETTLSTAGNLNNFLGVPLTLMRGNWEKDHYAVVEAGISEKNEMGVLAEMIQPNIAVITSVGPAHLEGLGTVENVAAEKLKLGLGERTHSIFIDSTASQFVREIEGKELYSICVDDRLGKIGSYKIGEETLYLRLPGGVEEFPLINSSNSLASNVALSLSVAASLEISTDKLRERLSNWRPSGMRGEWIEVDNKCVYLDCYNANPLSMIDSLESFVKNSDDSAARLFVIGGMEELGEGASSWHEQLGENLSLRDQDRLCIVGRFADDVLRGFIGSGGSAAIAQVVQSMQELKQIVNQFTGSVFLKGSRRYQLENALDDALKNSRKDIS